MPEKHPLDPDNKLSDEEYNNVVDSIQNEKYRQYIFWQRVRNSLTIISVIFLILIILYFIVR